jgi:hypothetical protein
LKIVDRLRGWQTQAAFKYMPILADGMTNLATYTARRTLTKSGPLRLLLDSQIHSHAITHEATWIESEEKIRGGARPIQAGFARVAVHAADDDSDEYRDICYLTGICYLAKRRHIHLSTSRELMAERDKQPPRRFKPVGIYDFNLLSRLDIQPIDGWSNESYVHDKEKTGITLHQRQLNRVNSSTDRCFLKIWKLFGKGEKQSLDAWHLRTAQEHGLDGILTMDYRLANTFKQKRSALNAEGISARIWTPSELAVALGIHEVPPNLFCYTGASYPVRPDLYLPTGRRRPTK